MYRLTYTSMSTGEVNSTAPIGTSSATFMGFNPYESYNVTVEVVAVSPATQQTISTCSGFTQQSGIRWFYIFYHNFFSQNFLPEN